MVGVAERRQVAADVSQSYYCTAFQAGGFGLTQGYIDKCSYAGALLRGRLGGIGGLEPAARRLAVKVGLVRDEVIVEAQRPELFLQLLYPKVSMRVFAELRF